MAAIIALSTCIPNEYPQQGYGNQQGVGGGGFGQNDRHAEFNPHQNQGQQQGHQQGHQHGQDQYVQPHHQQQQPHRY